MLPLVSVIIPTFGDNSLLTNAIQSVIQQTYTNLEIIVIDDNGLGSEQQQQNQSLLECFCHDTRIVYLCHERNINGAAARNTGIRNSHGDYIAFLDDDDLCYPKRIEEQINALLNLGDEYAGVYCGCDVYINEEFVRRKIARNSKQLLFELLAHKIDIETSSLLLKKDAINKIGLFDESFNRHQDWEYLARIATHYKLFGIDYVGVKRNLVFRNSAKSPEMVEKYREHYLNSMDSIIKLLPLNQQKEILIRNRTDVALQYLKSKNYFIFAKKYLAMNPGFKGFQVLIEHLMLHLTH